MKVLLALLAFLLILGIQIYLKPEGFQNYVIVNVEQPRQRRWRWWDNLYDGPWNRSPCPGPWCPYL